MAKLVSPSTMPVNLTFLHQTLNASFSQSVADRRFLTVQSWKFIGLRSNDPMWYSTFYKAAHARVSTDGAVRVKFEKGIEIR
jgi:hypothetical protein